MGSQEKCEIIIQSSHYGSLVQAAVTLVCLAATSQQAECCAELLHFCPTFVIFKHRKLMAPLFAPLFTTLPFYQAQGRAGCGSQLYRHSFYLFKACEHS